MHMCIDAGAIANASRHGLHFIKGPVIILVQIYLVLIWHTCQIHISYTTYIFQLKLVQRLKKSPHWLVSIWPDSHKSQTPFTMGLAISQ